jgi:hypothetical protein
MRNSLFSFKILIFAPFILLFLIFLLIFGWIYYQRSITKELKLISPNGKEVLQAGSSYKITWKARKVDKIDIVLVLEEEPKKSKVIVNDFPANRKEYLWQIFAFEAPSDRYKIGIFESPRKEGNKIDYSDDYFTILAPKFASCDELTIKNNWPFVPSDYPNLKKVFITTKSYTGNLDGLEGADKICQKEAKERGLKGNWKAFLGDDNISAAERLNLEGIFVNADNYGGLPQEKLPAYFWTSFGDYLTATSAPIAGSSSKERSQRKKLRKNLTNAYTTLTQYFNAFTQDWNLAQESRSCFHLLASNFQGFFQRLSSPYLLLEGRPENEFLNNFFGQEIWLGRINPQEGKGCIIVSPRHSSKGALYLYSSTHSCQNWTTEKEKIEASSFQEGKALQCYTAQGGRINASAIGGVARIVSKKEDKISSTLSLGRSCKEELKLLCIEQ